MNAVPVAIDYLDETVYASLSGEIDHHTSRMLRAKIDDAISRAVPQRLVMDFAHVTFMDSSGIGLIMGRYQQISVYGGRLSLSGLNTQQKKVMRLAGLDRLVDFETTGGAAHEGSPQQNEAGV